MTAAQRIAARYLERQGMSRTAGEVRFIKDRGGDKNEWGWGSPGPTEREIQENFEFNPTKLKPLAKALRSTLMALGHVQSGYNEFTRVKSAQVSPDGNLGGKGYIQKIGEMRRQYMNCSEALSALSDTLYDEINASHWNPAIAEQDPREREQVKDIMEDSEEIRENPEGWAESEEAELDDESGNAEDENGENDETEPDDGGQLKQAGYSGGGSVGRVVDRYLHRRSE